MNIQESKLSIYMEEDIKYITPKMIFFSVCFFIIKQLFLCVKQKSLRDVSFTHQTHVLLTVIKIVHIFLISAYLELFRIISTSKFQIS